MYTYRHAKRKHGEFRVIEILRRVEERRKKERKEEEEREEYTRWRSRGEGDSRWLDRRLTYNGNFLRRGTLR